MCRLLFGVLGGCEQGSIVVDVVFCEVEVSVADIGHEVGMDNLAVGVGGTAEGLAGGGGFEGG